MEGTIPERRFVMADQIPNDSATPGGRKLTANQQFIADACEAWNELRHPSWPQVNVKKPSSRLIAYLQKTFKYADKDPDEATRIVRVGLTWIRRNDDWAHGQVFTFEQIAANEKLEAATSKADHLQQMAQDAASDRGVAPRPTPGPGGTTAVTSAARNGIQAGDICSAFGSAPVEVLRDILGNGHVFLVRHLSTGLMERVAHYELRRTPGVSA